MTPPQIIVSAREDLLDDVVQSLVIGQELGTRVDVIVNAVTGVALGLVVKIRHHALRLYKVKEESLKLPLFKKKNH